MTSPITPTVGRVVLFDSPVQSDTGASGGPVPALITRIWSNDCVNLQVMRDAVGPVAVTSVLYSEEPNGSRRWHWMPYQKAVAAGEAVATLHETPPVQANEGA